MVEVDLNSSFLRGLTHLKFTFGLFRPSDSQNFLKILPDMVTLESLDVDGTIPLPVTPRQSSTTGTGKIHIPTLKKLRIDASKENITTLLSILELTSDIDLYLLTCLNNLDAHPLDSLGQSVDVLKLLSAIFAPKGTPSLAWTTTTPPPPRSHIKTYRIMRDRMENFRIQAFRNVLTHEEMLTSAIPPSIDWNFGLDYPLEDEDEEKIARRLLDVLPLDHVITLQVFGKLPYGEDLLVEKFGYIPTLKSILLGNDVASLIFEALTFGVDNTSSVKPAKTEPEMPPLAFPILDTIYLQGSAVRYAFENRKVLENFTRELMRRRAIGSPVRRLVLIDYLINLDGHVMLRLRDAVAHVEELKIDNFEDILETDSDSE